MKMKAVILALFCATHVAFAEIPAFKVQEIDASLTIGYGVLLVDVNADKKPDIVVADKDRAIWFENPTWKLRVITEGKAAPDNVCIDAHDIDADGQLDLVLGAGWQPGNTKEPSTLHWLRRGKSLDEPWEMFPITYEEPTLHRMRFADFDNSGEKVLITVPLMGRGSTKEQNWAEAGVNVQVRPVPADPTKPQWPAQTISTAYHVPHNFQVHPAGDRPASDMLVASFEGVSVTRHVNGAWRTDLLAVGDQTNPTGNRGASEIRRGMFADGKPFIATIQPWHGHQVVVYADRYDRRDSAENTVRQPHLVDDQLRWGHAIWCADLNGDGGDEIVVGVRDPLPGKAKSGVRVYQLAADGKAWTKSELDPGGVAVEDLAVADLDADGKPDIVAVGRQTKNVRVYWNRGKP